MIVGIWHCPGTSTQTQAHRKYVSKPSKLRACTQAEGKLSEHAKFLRPWYARLRGFESNGEKKHEKKDAGASEREGEPRGHAEERRGWLADLLENCRSDGVLASPLTSRRFVPRAVGLVDVGDLGHERVVRVGVCEHGADRKQN